MFDVLIREASTRFNLGNKAQALLQMLLARMFNQNTGGLKGFLDLFINSGAAPQVQSWLGGGAGAQPLKDSQVEAALGASGGLLSMITERLDLSRDSITSAIGYLLPPIVGKLTAGSGTLPAQIPDEVLPLVSAGQSQLDAPPPAASSGGGLLRWLPLLLLAALLALGLAFCSRGGSGSAGSSAPAPAPAKPAPAPASAAKPAPASAPASAPVAAPADNKAAADEDRVEATDDASGNPLLRVFFGSGKSALPAGFGDFAAKIKAWLDEHTGASALISGFTDSTGDAAANAELAKKRAEGVRDALIAAGIPAERLVLAKPASATSGDGDAARRVDVRVRYDDRIEVLDDANARPMLRVFFGSGKSAVPAGFAERAEAVKDWLDEHKDAKLGISGFNDPTGDAAANAELSKNRAENVRAALAEMGIAADRLVLEKPVQATDDDVSLAEARRVEIVVREAGDAAPAAAGTGAGATAPAATASAAPAANAAPAAGASAAAGDDLPMLRVYFDTGKADMPVDFAVTDEIKTYIATHSDASVSISGFNDASGDAAANSELAKKRAETVRAALVAAGIPAERINLDKPRDATENEDTLAESRRVDVRVVRK